MNRAFRAHAAEFHQSCVHLVAPEILVQLQGLTNEIAAANDVKKHFCVYVTNEGNPQILSFVTGEIFIPSRFIEMVDNRDEMAFGLAREVAYQGLLLPMKHRKAQYIAMDRESKTRTISSLLIANAVGSLWGVYVQGPLHQRIMAQIPQTYDPIAEAVRMRAIMGKKPRFNAKSAARVRMIQPLIASSGSNFGDANRLVGDLLDLSTGWIPNLISHGFTEAVVRILASIRLDVDPRFRVEKDRLGLYFMSAAGYNPDAATEVIRKRAQFEEILESRWRSDK